MMWRDKIIITVGTFRNNFAIYSAIKMAPMYACGVLFIVEKK